MFESVEKNIFGFYELKQKPSSDELSNYYSEKYYQEPKGSYQKQYSDEEIKYINNKIEQKYLAISNLLSISNINPSFLDIGCGEGWALNYFKKMGWKVCGVDYSSFGCEVHNPDCSPHLKPGDIYEVLANLTERKEQFDVIWLDNILEHVLQPYELLLICKKLVSQNGILVIEVPNDFSLVQMTAVNLGFISEAFWVVDPDHFSYFNKEGLNALCKAVGWECRYLLGDFPIDFNLYNIDSNYIMDKSKGKNCHKSRVLIENLIHDISASKANDLYEALGELGLGRQIIGFYQPKKSK